MPAHVQADENDLPSIDDTIAAVSVLGRILDEMRSRLAAAELAVANLQKEKRALRSELRAIVDYAVLRPIAPSGVQVQNSPIAATRFDDELLAIMKGIDSSFGSRSARH